MSLRARTETPTTSPTPEPAGGALGTSNALALATTPSGDGLTADQRSAAIANGTRRTIYEEHRQGVAAATPQLGDFAWAADRFLAVWNGNRARYERVAAATGVPAELIAAIHFRESSGNFGTYLHNGEPLGRVTTKVPAGLYFTDWEEAAIDALLSKAHVANDLSMTAETDDLAAMATYAEYYNGLGYHYRGYESAYVYSGTSQYTGGKFVDDGVFDPRARDQQLGVVAMVQMAQGTIDARGNRRTPTPGTTPAPGPTPAPAPAPAPATGGPVLQRGSTGPDVSQLQQLLNRFGRGLTVDGDFGARTEAAVRAVQAILRVVVDGVVGPLTRAAMDAHLAAQTNATPAPTGSDLAGVVAAIGGVVLKQGARGPQVIALQRALGMLGHAVPVDGDFGPITDRAVRAFQAARGLEVDGEVGPATRGAMLGTSAAPTPAPAGPTPVEGPAQDELPTGAQGDDETERRLDTFFQAFNGIPVRTNPGQTPATYVDVIPSYHINSGHRLNAALAERQRNPAVHALIQTLPARARVGKATPDDLRTFLETAIAQGLITDRTAGGMRNFLARYGVGTDCSGLVSQALNHLRDGNMTVDAGDLLDPMFVGSASLQGGQGQFDAVAAPRDLRAGDTMYIPGHIRILVDVDVDGQTVTFRTIESTPREDVVDPEQRDARDTQVADGGIGDAHWRYADGGRFRGLERSADGGQTWAVANESPSFGRWRNLPQA